MPATLTTVSGILKEVYEPRLREQLDDGNIALKRIEKTSEGTSRNIGGRYVTFAIHTKRNTGLGARQEMELLPTAGQQSAAAATQKLKYLYGAVQLSGQTLELVDTDIQAFTSALDFEMSGLQNDVTKDLNRQVYGSGNGAIGVVTSIVTAATIPVDRADLFQIGELVDLVSLPCTVATAGRTVTAVDLTAGANTVTISGANVTTSTTPQQILTRGGSGPVSASLNREWDGFGKIIAASGALYGVDPATEPVWKSEIDGNAGTNRALSEGLMITMVDRIKTWGGKTTAIFTSMGVRRAYFNLLSSQRTFANVKDFTGGFTGLGFVTDTGEVPLVVDIDAPRNKMIFVNENEITLYRSSDWSFLDRAGSKWTQVPGYDAWSCTLHQYSELGTHRRNSHGRIDDITEG